MHHTAAARITKVPQVQLHLFCDTSRKPHAVKTGVRLEHDDGFVHVSFICGPAGCASQSEGVTRDDLSK